MGSSKIESQLNEAHQRAVYHKARELMHDHTILLRALGEEGVEYISDNQSDHYLDKLAELALSDDTEAFGRRLLDQVIHYVWALAEQEVSQLNASLKH